MLDASAIIELLLNTTLGHAVSQRVADPLLSLHAPHLVDIEVASTLRRYVRDGELEAAIAEEALVALRQLDVERHAHEDLLERIWALRDNVTPYDAAYVALAEALDAKLLTCDAKLYRAPGVSAIAELMV